MNELENNKRIAEFMGFTLDTPTNIGGAVWYDNEEVYLHISSEFKHSNCFKELQFHEEWNWLMPVVEKIDNLFGEDDIVDDMINKVHNAVLQFNRDITYNAVVEFIKQYNENEAQCYIQDTLV